MTGKRALSHDDGDQSPNDQKATEMLGESSQQPYKKRASNMVISSTSEDHGNQSGTPDCGSSNGEQQIDAVVPIKKRKLILSNPAGSSSDEGSDKESEEKAATPPSKKIKCPTAPDERKSGTTDVENAPIGDDLEKGDEREELLVDGSAAGADGDVVGDKGSSVESEDGYGKRVDKSPSIIGHEDRGTERRDTHLDGELQGKPDELKSLDGDGGSSSGGAAADAGCRTIVPDRSSVQEIVPPASSEGGEDRVGTGGDSVAAVGSDGAPACGSGGGGKKPIEQQGDGVGHVGTSNAPAQPPCGLRLFGRHVHANGGTPGVNDGAPPPTRPRIPPPQPRFRLFGVYIYGSNAGGTGAESILRLFGTDIRI